MNRIKNAKRQTVDGVLFLQGVFKSDCNKIEDFFHARLLSNINKTAKVYDKIPLTFTGLATWPASTNLLCWSCSRAVKGRPWFEPQSINPLSKGQVGIFISSAELKRDFTKTDNYCINVKGNFCSAQCVMRNILTYSKDMLERIDKVSMLMFIYEIFTGQRTQDIYAALPHYEMVQYGGTMSDADYQRKLDELAGIHVKPADTLTDSCKMYLSNIKLDD